MIEPDPSGTTQQPKVSIRAAAPRDAGGVLDCLQAAFAPYRSQYTAEAFADTVLTPERLQHRFAVMHVFVAVTPAGEIVGTLACEARSGGEGHLRGMAVRPEWQGRGAATALLAAAEAHLQERGCKRVTLDTTQPLRRAASFYVRRGYRPSGGVSEFYGMTLFEYVKTFD